MARRSKPLSSPPDAVVTEDASGAWLVAVMADGREYRLGYFGKRRDAQAAALRTAGEWTRASTAGFGENFAVIRGPFVRRNSRPHRHG